MGQISKMKLGVNLQILKILRGQIIIFEKIEGSICNFKKIIRVKLKILGTKMQKFKKYNNEEF